ncbi:fumarylacetoacetate hydrolase family protein [Occallatibacter riparius]|uniref:Fumarylacetoacetate hydrolase family protein n=1 Tax=Occallatibacter riparius TaxID=1002689 RepID=A0A9J7BJZ9_9BACT|nr:fumarylacetoacetate hydrolase family protein [Occallatibacter riparius]UWZ82883.1 fumarylacetoacetate hydrolase family protein [Occallatibacter riparius]
MRLFRTTTGSFVEKAGKYYPLNGASWNELFQRDDLEGYLASTVNGDAKPTAAFSRADLLPPIEQQEVWAAGVTYYRSRSARMEESESAGGGDFYDRVYSAPRPELFFKSTASRTVGSGGKVRIRHDAKWSVPEPELVLVISAQGKIVGYTIGNDMSSRDIEGENPLYLPQAKVYDGSCALGPGILVASKALPRTTEIALEIFRGEGCAFAGCIKISEIKRDFATLVEYLFRDNSFPNGCFLMTGTGIVPPNDFTLDHGDRVRITIDPIGTLENEVA